MPDNKFIQDLHQVIDGSVSSFDSSIGSIQKDIYKEISMLLKDLETSGDTIKPTAKNISIIGKIKAKIEKIVRSDSYNKNVKTFLGALDEITNVQHQYFNSITEDYSPSTALKELKAQAIDDALNSLKGAGITANITEKLQSILRSNVTSGASYLALMNQMRDYLITNESGQGALEKYTKQITTDTLNQYAAQYNSLVSNDLGLKWYRYTGALINTSRPFCEACKKKQFIYESELEDVVKGNFKEFDQENGKIDSRTDLPSGMIPGTNADNFKIYRGGYNCGHQLVPVSEVVVPKNIRIEVYSKQGIKYDSDGFAN